MDYVPAHGNTNMLDDREDTSGARVFDGEDQGKLIHEVNKCKVYNDESLSAHQ